MEASKAAALDECFEVLRYVATPPASAPLGAGAEGAGGDWDAASERGKCEVVSLAETGVVAGKISGSRATYAVWAPA